MDSSLAGLNVEMSTKNLIVKSGRLKRLYDGEIPIIPKGKLAKLILSDAHKATLCGSDSEVAGYVAWQYEIIGKKDICKQIRKACRNCLRYRGGTAKQLMGEIPEIRITPAYPFAKIAIDYAGPIYLKSSRIRRETDCKAWIMVSVCLVTKAVHLELVGDCSGNTLLLALLRMFATRGKPQIIISDNGKNFVYAARELHEIITKQQNEARKYCQDREIEWSFCPTLREP